MGTLTIVTPPSTPASALSPPSPPSPSKSVFLIQSALEPTQSPLQILSLHNTLHSTNAALVTPLLLALPHFSTRLYTPDSHILRKLFQDVLQVDIPTLAAEQGLRHAMCICLADMVSADAGFVEPVLGFMVRLLKSGRPEVLPICTSVMGRMLAIYSRGNIVVKHILRRGYPHPVRPVDEHVAYMSGLLKLIREYDSLSGLFDAVMEKVAAIESLVGDVECVDHDAMHDAEGEAQPKQMTPEAAKLDAVLVVLFEHLAEVSKKSQPNPAIMEKMLDAYQRFILPVDSRFTVYIIIYAAELHSSRGVDMVIENFWSGFADPSLSRDLRERYLQHWTAILIRSQSCDTARASKCLQKLLSWIHYYIDDARLRRRAIPDADIHRLFYSACGALFIGLSSRKDVTAGGEVLEKWRVYRVLECALRPLSILHGSVVHRFLNKCEVAGDIGGDVGVVPSRTRFGRRNRVTICDRGCELKLTRARQVVGNAVRWD